MRLRKTMRGVAAALVLSGGAMLHGQNAVVMDRVVAVVNNQAILESDVANEQRLSVLEPERRGRRTVTEQRALQMLISRALIEQQLGQAGVPAPETTDEYVQLRLKSLREELPACVAANCKSSSGWAKFLEDNGLTEAEVERYLRLRLELLGFIETRFRQGIQISQEQVAKYYNETLLPQYPKDEKPPALKTVAPRIEEILLQQQVNVLFGTWLSDLRKQGDVEVLDKTLEMPGANGQGNGGGDKDE